MPTMHYMIKFLKSQVFWQSKMRTYHFKTLIELRSVLVATLFLGFILGFSSCENDVIEEVPADAGVRSVDVKVKSDFELEVSTEFEEALRTDRINTGLLGQINDPSVGNSVYGIATEFSLPSGNINLPAIDNLVVDSLKLILSITDLYGPDELMNLKAYRLTELIDTNEFYSNEIDRLSLDDFSEISITPDPFNTVNIDGVDESASIQINLPKIWGQEIMDNRSTSLTSDEGLRQAFKGVYLTANENANQKSVLLLNMINEFSRLKVYFQDKFYANDSLNTKFSLEFPIIENSSRVGIFEHDWNQGILDMVSSEGSIERNLVHSAAGTNILVKVSGLEELKGDKNIVVNGASLRIPVSEVDDAYPNQSRLYLITRSADGGAQFIPDIFRGTQSYGGAFDVINNEYVFSIPEFIQGVIDDKFENNGLVIVDGAGYFSRIYNPRRSFVIQSDGDNKIEFTLTYSEN